MKQPDFIGIGTPKSGTTWLQYLLMSHPQVFIPAQRNEIHFFNRQFDKGLDWYNKFFENCTTDKIAGEVTPHYVYIPDSSIIKQVPTIKKFIFIHRDPVDRFVSNYKFRVRMDNLQLSFAEFTHQSEKARNWGYYGKHLANFTKHFSPEQILVLEYKEATQNIEKTKKALALFLGIDAQLFPENAGHEVVNKGFVPKRRGLYHAAIRVSQTFVKFELYGLRNWVRKQKWVMRFFQSSDKSKSKINIDQESIQYLTQLYASDQELFKKMLPAFTTPDKLLTGKQA